MVILQKYVWLIVFLSNQITCTEHHMPLYPSTGDPGQSLSHHYTSSNTVIVMTPYLGTSRLLAMESSTPLKPVDEHYMTSAMYPIPSSTSSSFESAMLSITNGTSSEPTVRLTCYSCSGTGCGQERQHYDPLRQCGAGEFCYFEMINDGMMILYKRGCVGDMNCQKSNDKFSCRHSRRNIICQLCCQYNKCNSMAWTPPNTTTSMTPEIATVIVVIIVTRLWLEMIY